MAVLDLGAHQVDIESSDATRFLGLFLMKNPKMLFRHTMHYLGRTGEIPRGIDNKTPRVLNRSLIINLKYVQGGLISGTGGVL